MVDTWQYAEFNGKLPMPRTLATLGDPAAFIAADEIALSQKLDGRRLMILRNSSSVIGVSRSGTETDVPSHLLAAFSRVQNGWIFDGELIGDDYHVFDVLRMPDLSLTSHSWRQRQDVLNTVLGEFDPNVKIVKQVYGFLKADYFEQLQQSNAEGCIFAETSGVYRYGVRNNSIGKFKFLKDVDCIITDMGEGGSDNLVLGVYQDGIIREIGKVSALTGDGKHHDFKIGEVVQVTYLYVTKDLRLYQPVKPKLRLDKSPDECTIDQIIPFLTSKDVLN